MINIETLNNATAAMTVGQGILAAVSKSSNASKDLADDGKNILFIDHNSFTIFFNSTEYRLKLSEKAMDSLSRRPCTLEVLIEATDATERIMPGDTDSVGMDL